MKKDIHPKFTEKATITCACGNSFEAGSTLKEIRVELCNLCHPFYTGKQKFVDTARRVEKFEAKLAKATGVKKVKKTRKTEVKAEEAK